MRLTKPNCLDSSISNLSSFCFCLYHVLPYLNQNKYSFEEIMGYTGHAFHLNIRVDSIDKWGPTMYDWDGLIPSGLGNLGLNTKTVGYSGYHINVPNVLNNSIGLIRQSIQRGIPLIMWEPLGPEFGIIYGYDDENQILFVVDAKREGEISFDRIGRGEDTPEFYVVAVEEDHISSHSRIKNTINLILKYGLNDSHDSFEFSTGLPAYDAWISALKNQKADVYGQAFNIQVLKNARKSAISFLDKFKNEFIKGKQQDKVILSKTAYSEVVDLIEELETLFPYPNGGNPRDQGNINNAVQLLKEIRYKEESALMHLKALSTII